MLTKFGVLFRKHTYIFIDQSRGLLFQYAARCYLCFFLSVYGIFCFCVCLCLLRWLNGTKTFFRFHEVSNHIIYLFLAENYFICFVFLSVSNGDAFKDSIHRFLSFFFQDGIERLVDSLGLFGW